MLQHYRLSPLRPEENDDPIRYLGWSMHWDCCGFFDTAPKRGCVTVPQAGIHICMDAKRTWPAEVTYTMNMHPPSWVRSTAWCSTR